MDFKAVKHEVKEMLPAIEKPIASHSYQVMKEGATDGKGLSQQAIFMVGNM